MSLTLPFCKAKFGSFNAIELPSLQALSLGFSARFVSSRVQTPSLDGEYLPPYQVDLVQRVPAFGETLCSLVLLEELSDKRWKDFFKAAFGCFSPAATAGSLRNLTRLDLEWRLAHSVDHHVEVVRCISRTCPLLTRLRLLLASIHWTELFHELSKLEHLEHLETTASALSSHWSSLRSLKKFKYLALMFEGSADEVYERLFAQDLLFVALYNIEHTQTLLFAAHYQTEPLFKLLNSMEEKGLPCMRSSAFQIAIGAPTGHKILRHPYLFSILAQDESISAEDYIVGLRRALYHDSPPLKLLFAPFIKKASPVAWFSRSLLPRRLVNEIRRWLRRERQHRRMKQDFESKLVALIPDLLSPATQLSELISFNQPEEALKFLRVEVAKGPETAARLVLDSEPDPAFYTEPLHAILRMGSSALDVISEEFFHTRPANNPAIPVRWPVVPLLVCYDAHLLDRSLYRS